MNKNADSNHVKRAKKQAPKKRKSAVFELIYGFLCVFITALFCLVPIFLLEKSGAIVFNIKYGFFFLVFILVCAVGAGFFLFYKQYVNRTMQAKELHDACNKILKGEYEIDIEDLSGDYKKVADVLIAVSRRLKLADKEKNDFITYEVRRDSSGRIIVK